MTDRPERRKRDPVLFACATLGLLSAIVVGIFVAPAVVNSPRDDEFREALLGQCARVQVERERSNVAEAVIYEVLRSAGSSNSNQAPAYTQIATATAYSPPAECEEAVRHPRDYRLPPPVPFTDLPDCFARQLIY